MPSELLRYTKDQKDPGSNPTRRSAGFWDPALLRGFRCPRAESRIKCNE